ncbi:MAG: DUF364 domain-containing protein, partial [Candidatus Riflebacteria bacterium]
MDIYNKLKSTLKAEIEARNLQNASVSINCKALSVKEAIGTPEHNDYPIQKGKEVMIEADFLGTKGQAFTDTYENRTYMIEDLLALPLDNNREKASFVATLNAVWRHFGKCGKTVHCKDKEPVECAGHLGEKLDFSKKTLLVGLQPRFLEQLAKNGNVRVLDLDADNIGRKFGNVIVESASNFKDAAQWCDQIFSTGSTICNGSIEE